jgi:hypothetical protein
MKWQEVGENCIMRSFIACTLLQVYLECSTNEGVGNGYRILVGKSEGKRPLGRLTRRWMDNIKMDHRKTRLGAMDWTDLAQDRDQWRTLVNTAMNFRVP